MTLARQLLLGAGVWVALAGGSLRGALGADLSARLAALIHDVLQPHAEGSYAPPDSSKAAYERTCEILRKERLLGTSRPRTATADLDVAYAKALGLGNNATKVLPEVGQLHGAASRGDREAVRPIIRTIYRELDRSVPEAERMDELVHAVEAAARTSATGPTEEYTVGKPDYELTARYSPPTGHVSAEVQAKQPGGEPFRARFSGKVAAAPSADGKRLELAAVADAEPTVIDSAKSRVIAERLSGDWLDQANKAWRIDVDGDAVTLTNFGRNNHPVVYQGTYKLGRITASHTIDHPDDITQDLPDPVREQLASEHRPPFVVQLEASEDGSRLDGTWTSRHVSYSEMSMSITRIHDPFDAPLRLRPAGGERGDAPGGAVETAP